MLLLPMYYVAIITIPFGGYVVATFCFKRLFFCKFKRQQRAEEWLPAGWQQPPRSN
jgi:hypothetical protein